MSKVLITIAVALGLTLGTVSFSTLTGIAENAVACKDKGSSTDTDKGEDGGKET